MKPENDYPSEWQPCPPGTLHDLAASQRQGRRVATMQRMVKPIATLSLLVCVILIATQMQTSNRSVVDDISCESFVEKIPQYLSGQLDAEAIQAMDKHMTDCPKCRDKLLATESATASVWEPSTAKHSDS